MAKEAGEDVDGTGRAGVIGRMGGRDQKKVEEDYELFLRDIEEDEEVRASVNLYKKPGAGSGMAGGKTRRKGQFAMDLDDVEPQQQHQETAHTQESMEETEGEEEADFPEVKLDELLDYFDEMTLGEAGEAEQT